MVDDFNTANAAENTPKKHSGADPSESPYYNRIFWASYKGQSRGLWGGLLLGAGLGAIGGLAIGIGVALIPGVAAAGVAASTVVTAIAGMGALAGMMYSKEVFTLSGAVAGAVAAGMEIAEERERERGISQSVEQTAKQPVMTEDISTVVDAVAEKFDSGKLATGEKPYKGNETFSWLGRKHHGEGERPLFFAGVGLAGAAIGAAAGIIIALVGGEGMSLLQHMGVGTDLGLNATAVGGVLTAGTTLIGASYGINRHNYRDVFDVTNKLYDGALLGKAKEKSVAVAKATQPVQEQEAPLTGQALPEDGWRRLNAPDSTVSSAQLHEQGRVQQDAPSEHDIIH